MLLFYLSLLDTEEEQSKLEKLYYQYKALMKYIALDILKDDGMADDAVHDAFIKLTRHLDGIDEIKSHKTKGFIVIVIRSVCLDTLEKEKRNKFCSLEEVADDLSIDDSILDNMEAKDICEKIMSLPDIHRDILQLKVYYEYSDKKIADLLGISHQAIRKRLQRARNVLGKLLKERGGN